VRQFRKLIWVIYLIVANIHKQYERNGASTTGDIRDVGLLMFCTCTVVAVRRPTRHVPHMWHCGTQAGTVHRHADTLRLHYCM